MSVAKTVPDALKLLWKDGFFLTPRNLSNIKRELESRGYNFVDSRLSHSLTDVQFLTRRGPKGKYAYVQKHPFFGDDEVG